MAPLSEEGIDEDEHPALQRWMTVPLLSKAKLSKKGSSFSSLLLVERINISDEGINGLDNNYTSLSDLLQDDQSSPRLQSPTSCYDIPIKNMLVKQAAYAYLQPKTSPKPQIDQSWFGSILLPSDEAEPHRSSDGCKGFVGYIFKMFVVVIKRVLD
ncbi:hypothetical protein ZOSMA_146G00160 [Zostera marina]|uniref:Uncharacterized protein n=1 Tax=Zostera marina TaxID=29655 RepID=A0A0K9PX12_ZOSMR|nr:hypothetical protein ZOSMA_146G00160 [Zostera marina]